MLNFKPIFAVLALTCLGLSVTSPALALTEQDLKDCDSLQMEPMIRGCSALIDERRLPIPNEIRALAHMKRGMAYFSKRDFGAAVADLDKSRKLNPNDIGVYNELGLALRAKGETKAAIAAFADGLKLDGKHGDLLYNRGVDYITDGDLDKAVADLKAAIVSGPPGNTGFIDAGKLELAARAHAYGNYFKALAGVYAIKGQHDLAIATHDEAVKLYPNTPVVYVNRAEGFTIKGDKARAVADLDQAVGLAPKDGQVLGQRAFVRFELGDFTGAAADWKAAWSIDPAHSGMPRDYVPIWIFAAEARGDAKAALDGLRERAKVVTPGSWPNPVIELMSGRSDLAGMIKAAASPDEVCQGQFYAGEWHAIRGDATAARTAWQTAVDTCPTTFFEYRGAIAELGRTKK